MEVGEGTGTGTDLVTDKGPSQPVTATEQGVIAAMEFVPAWEKRAYMEAKQKAPRVVEGESKPSRFLKVERYLRETGIRV